MLKAKDVARESLFAGVGREGAGEPCATLGKQRARADQRDRIADIGLDAGGQQVGEPGVREHACAGTRHAGIGQAKYREAGRHARDRIEIYAYALTPPDPTPWRADVMANADHWREIAHMQAFEAAGLMLCDDLDVLIDLTTDMTRARPELHRYHPARANIDGCAAGMPAVRLPPDPRWPARAREGSAQSRAALGLPAQAIVLCCPHPAHAIEPGVFGAWMEILRGSEAAVLGLSLAGRAR